jgi:transcriptional regulator with XRE-family HTH domain
MNGHPAVELGLWLKAKRQAKKTVARVFAGRIGLSPAEYAELEAGVIKWLRQKQENLIPLMLDLSEQDLATFNNKASLARGAKALAFQDVFTRDQLTPVRLCSPKGEQLTAETREAILDAVFTPLT